MNKRVFILILSVVFAVACSQNKEEKKSETNEKTEETPKKGKRKLETVKTSELATLMRKMDSELQTVKQSLVNDEAIDENITFEYATILTATPTETDMKGESFDGFATAYLQQLDKFKKSAKEKKVENFNLLINSCLSCHENTCPGPKGKIRELLIN
jgi:PBP1b-binding outer membrane lipoprotein LpoB